jgi:hypothetical protein
LLEDPNKLHEDVLCASPSPEMYDKGDSMPNHQLKPANVPNTKPTVRFFFQTAFLELPGYPNGLSLYIGSESLRSELNMFVIFSPIPPSLWPFCPARDH